MMFKGERGDQFNMMKTSTTDPTIIILIREGNFTRSSIFDVDEKEIFRGDGEVQIYADADNADADNDDNEDYDERVGEVNLLAMRYFADDDADKDDNDAEEEFR